MQVEGWKITVPTGVVASVLGFQAWTAGSGFFFM